ncbi:MAG: HAD family phosphatase [Actinocatenispora sp.]
MRRGLLVDYGGVLTGNVFASFDAFCVDAGLPAGRIVEVFRADADARDLLVGMERGTTPVTDFEQGLAARLGVGSAGLIRRLMARAAPDLAMLEAVRSARQHGIRTALVSNSWGTDGYDRPALAELFDAVLISGELGVRKPSREIYQRAADAIGVPTGQCVFVDDLAQNLTPARALGMTTVLHDDTATTLAQLATLLDVPLP